MTRLLTLTAVAALFATGASAQMAPSFEPSAENCKKPQYSTTDECKNFLEGRSSSSAPNKPTDSLGSSKAPGADGSSSGGSGAGGAGGGSGGPGGL